MAPDDTATDDRAADAARLRRRADRRPARRRRPARDRGADDLLRPRLRERRSRPGVRELRLGEGARRPARPRPRAVLRAVGLLRRAAVRALVHPRHEAPSTSAASPATARCGSCPRSTSSPRSCCCASASTARSARRRTTRRAPARRRSGGRCSRSSRSRRATPAARRRCRYGQAWSLDAEAAFYLAAARSPPRSPTASAAGSAPRAPAPRPRSPRIGGLGLVSIYLRQGSDEFAVLTSPPFILYAFIPGIMLAAAEPLAAPRLRGEPARRPSAWPTALGAITVLAWALYANWDYAVQTTALHHALGRRALMAIVFSGAALAAVIVWQLGTERAPRWLDNRADPLARRALLRDLPASTSGSSSRSSTSSAPAPSTTTLVDRDDRDRPAGHARAVGRCRGASSSSRSCERRVRWASGEPTPGTRHAAAPATTSAQPAVDPTTAARSSARRRSPSARCHDARVNTSALRSAARAARLRTERARFELWARRLDARLRRAGGRLDLRGPARRALLRAARRRDPPLRREGRHADDPPRRARPARPPPDPRRLGRRRQHARPRRPRHVPRRHPHPAARRHRAHRQRQHDPRLLPARRDGRRRDRRSASACSSARRSRCTRSSSCRWATTPPPASA